MKDFLPLVSIVIPVYNGANYLRNAIDSALGQTYKNIEVLVVNDGSNDNGQTEKIVLSYGNKIKYYKKSNGGVATALNLGIEKMRGEYFSWLSHDDVYLENKISREISILSSLENKQTIIYSNYELINAENILIKKIDMAFAHRIDSLNCGLYAVVFGVLNGCTMLIPKSVFKKYGTFNINLHNTQDYEFWYRIFKDGYSIRYIREYLVKTRIHPEQGSKQEGNNAECDNLWTWILKDISHNQYKTVFGGEYKCLSQFEKQYQNSRYDKTLSFVQQRRKALRNPFRIIYTFLLKG